MASPRSNEVSEHGYVCVAVGLLAAGQRWGKQTDRGMLIPRVLEPSLATVGVTSSSSETLNVRRLCIEKPADAATELSPLRAPCAVPDLGFPSARGVTHHRWRNCRCGTDEECGTHGVRLLRLGVPLCPSLEWWFGGLWVSPGSLCPWPVPVDTDPVPGCLESSQASTVAGAGGLQGNRQDSITTTATRVKKD